MLKPLRLSFPFSRNVFSEVIDVRSPQEFQQDRIPGAINKPVLCDRRYQEIGTLYKSCPFSARRLGATYTTEAIHHYLKSYFFNKDKSYHPLVYCARGGMRSHSLGTVLTSIGWRTTIVENGYKGWRRFVIGELERLCENSEIPFRILSGHTGTGKSRLLEILRSEGAQVIHLEELAGHRGSLLGGVGAQPSQRLFESSLYEVLQGMDLTQPVFIEAESNRIGKIHCPAPFWKILGRLNPQVKVFEVTLNLESRIALLKKDYVHFMESPEYLFQTLERFRKLRGNQLVDQWNQWIKLGEWDLFLSSLLKNHYDLSYRLPGAESSHYPAASTRISLGAGTQKDMHMAALDLIAHEVLENNS